MNIYISIIALGFLMMLPISNNRLRKLMLIFTGIIIFFVVGFRTWDVGTDTVTYVTLYPYLANLHVSMTDFFSSRFEIGFVWLTNVLYPISEHYSLLLATLAFFTIAPIFYIIAKDSKDYGLSLLIFIGTTFRLTMSSIRSALASSLVFLAFHFLKYGKKKLAIFLIVLSSFFHISSLAMLPLILGDRKWSNTVRKLMLLVSLVGYVTVDKIILLVLGNSKYVTYLEGGVAQNWLQGGQKISLILQFVIFLLVFLLGMVQKKASERMDVKRDEKEWYYEQIVYIGTLVSFLNINSAILSRLTYFFLPFLSVYLPDTIEQFKNERSRFIIKLLVAIFFIAYFFFIIILRPQWTGITHYQNVFFEK
ncbi:TPA: EpsG family protein [Streptococcus suis]